MSAILEHGLFFTEKEYDRLQMDLTLQFAEGTPTQTLLPIAEQTIIQRVYLESRYNQSKTAKRLGLSRGTLIKKLNEYKIW